MPFDRHRKSGAGAPRLLPREHRAGAAEPGHDLVGDEMDAVARGDLAREGEVARRRTSSCRTRPAPAARRSARPWSHGAARDARRARPPRRRRRRSGAGTHARCREQRRVDVAEQRHIGHGQRAQRLAVIAAGEAHERALVGIAAVAPVVEAHLERDLGRRRAVGAVERMAESRSARVRQPLRQLDHRAVREAREHARAAACRAARGPPR